MSAPLEAPSSPPWIEYLHKFASTLKRAEAEDLQTDLEKLQEDLEEIVENVEELREHLGYWLDDDLERSDRAEAKENVDTLVNQLEEQLDTLKGKL